MLGCAILGIALLLLLMEMVSLYWKNIELQEQNVKTMAMDAEIRWLRFPDHFGPIEKDWERILDETELCRK